MNLVKYKQKLTIFFASFLLVSPFFVEQVAANPLFCDTLSGVSLSSTKNLTAAQNLRMSKAIAGTLIPRTDLVKRASLTIKAATVSSYRKVYRSPANTLVFAAAEYYQLSELKRRAGNICVPFLSLHQAALQVENRPLTLQMLIDQYLDVNLDTDPAEFLENQEIIDILDQYLLDDKVREKLDS